MRSGLMWIIVVLAVAAAGWFLFGPGDTGDGPLDDGTSGTPDDGGAKDAGPELMGSGGTRPIVPTEIRGRGMLQGIARISGEGVAADVELRHVTELDPNNPAKGGFERMFIERLLDSGISGKDAIGRTTTGPDGRFKFKGLAPGLYEVRAQAASGAMGFASGMLPAHGARVEVNVDIPDGDQTLKGRVLYANDKPFEGMVVASSGMAFQAAMMGQAGQVRPAFTDEQGRFELGGLPKGRYQISAIIPGELRVMGAPIDVPYTGEYELKILVGGVTVKGKVISAATEEPIAGANVFGGGGNPEANFSIFSTQSGADGRFELTIPAGRGGGMFVRAAGYAPQMVEFRGGVDEDVVVSMLALGQLSGRVTQQDGGAPQKGVTVYASPQNQRGGPFGGGILAAITDADGRYVFEGVQPGGVQVHALGNGWASVGLSGFGFGQVKTPYVVELEPGGTATQDLEVVASGKVTGRVLAADGRPVPGAVVQAGPPRDVRQMVAMMMMLGMSFASAVSDGDGVYTIDAIVPGTEYALSAKAPEYPDGKSASFTAASGKTETLDITLPKARWLDVRVVAAGGTPVPGASVMAMPKRSDGMRVDFDNFFGGGALWTTDSEGMARVGPLPEGEFKIAARAAGYIQADTDVGETDDGRVTVELQKGLVLAGRIVMPEGAPAQSVRVRIARVRNNDGEWFSERAPVDASGRFRLDTIKEAGQYKLTASGRWENRRFTGSVTADAGDEDVVLEITASAEEKTESIEASVIDLDGKPVPAARITLTLFSDAGNSRSSSSARVNNGKATFHGFNTDGEVWVEVHDLVGSSRGSTIQGPLTITDGKFEVILPRPQVLLGTVKGPDGRGVAGVRIMARPVHPRGSKASVGRQHGEAVSDGDGRFEVKGLGPLEYELTASAPSDYAPVASQKVQAGTKGIVFTLRTGARAELLLLDFAGKPVSGASAWMRVPDEQRQRDLSGRVFMPGSSPTSDAEGVMALKGLEPGVRFDVTVSPPHERREELRPITLANWAPTNETLTFARAYTISGEVRTTEGKVPKNVNVRWRKVGEKKWNWGGNVSEDGSFKLTQLESGNYELKVGGGVETMAMPRAPGEAPPPEPNVTSARAGAKGVQLIVDFGATLTVKIDGMARASADGPTQKTAYLKLEGERGGQFLHGRWERSDTVSFRGLRTDATYTLWIGGLPGGKYVSQKGVRAQRATLTATTVQGGQISGVVKWPPEAGTLRHVGISAYSQAGPGGNAQVDLQTGRFTLTGLPEGEWVVTAHGWGEESGRWQGEAKATVGGEVEIVLKAQEKSPPR